MTFCSGGNTFCKEITGVSGAKKTKVVQNGLKHFLVLEFLRSDEIFEILYLS